MLGRLSCCLRVFPGCSPEVRGQGELTQASMLLCRRDKIPFPAKDSPVAYSFNKHVFLHFQRRGPLPSGCSVLAGTGHT